MVEKYLVRLGDVTREVEVVEDGEGLLARRYPSFERFAPGYGPLGKEIYRAFLRFASERDLGGWDADESVRLVREAYLVPMGLLDRSGRDYIVPKRLEQKELGPWEVIERTRLMLTREPVPAVPPAPMPGMPGP